MQTDITKHTQAHQHTLTLTMNTPRLNNGVMIASGVS
jgi:hypothetical protein